MLVHLHNDIHCICVFFSSSIRANAIVLILNENNLIGVNVYFLFTIILLDTNENFVDVV